MHLPKKKSFKKLWMWEKIASKYRPNPFALRLKVLPVGGPAQSATISQKLCKLLFGPYQFITLSGTKNHLTTLNPDPEKLSLRTITLLDPDAIAAIGATKLLVSSGWTI